MDDEPEKSYPLSPAKMSKVPSWVSVGFLLGIVAGWGLHPEPDAAPARPAPAMAPPKAAPPTKLTTIEAVFAKWGSYAVWSEEDHTAEIAFWDFDAHQYSEYYEVKRIGDGLFFRSIPHLTRNLVDYGDRLPADCPLRFTAPWREVQPARPVFTPDAPPRVNERPEPNLPAVPRQQVEPPKVAPTREGHA